MQIYLPIAEVAVDPFVIILMGGAVGFLSGMFGVGGGFLMTPLLIFYGIPPSVAVGTQASQVLASSLSGAMAQMRRGAIDMPMGWLLTGGGAAGSAAGVFAFKALREQGQADLVVTIVYVVFLGLIGGLMLFESVRALTKKGGPPPRRRMAHWISGMPLRIRFRRSQIYMSALPPLVLGAGVGALSALMGIGGGFIMVPAMIYFLGMPTNVVIGTSLFQITFVAAITTLLHASANQTVDLMLAALLLVGGVVGAQLGARVGVRMRGEYLRALLAIVVLVVCGRLMFELFAPPGSPYLVEIAQ